MRQITSNLGVFVSSMLNVLASSTTLTYAWNFGSILGIITVYQVITGVLLSIQYNPSSAEAFNSVTFIINENTSGWALRITHFNGANLFFIFLYLHLYNGLFFNSYRITYLWVSGITLLLSGILIAFLGYVLPWAQISFWACTVITSLLSVIPYLNFILLLWVWGGFSVNNSTLGLFFILHFLLPFVLLALIFIHLTLLHNSGSTSSLYCFGNYENVRFWPYFAANDSLNLLGWVIFFFLSFSYPFNLGDAEMFEEANGLNSPVHIVPEWYFLLAYAVLRAVPNNLMGVVLLLLSVLIYYVLVVVNENNSPFSVLTNLIIWWLLGVSMVLTWVGQCSVEAPYIEISMFFTFLYFLLIGALIVSQNSLSLFYE